MRWIFTVLVITILSILSCNENKSSDENSDNFEVEYRDKTDTQNVTSRDSGIVHSNSYSAAENQLTYVKDVDLFWIRDLEENVKEKVGFISLSDLYPLNEHPDSLAIPSPGNIDNQNLQYFKLNSTYRARFLSKSKISETDSIFIYDYSTDALLSFSIKNLNVVAYLNMYMDVDECPCSQYDYMIGFEIAKSNLTGLGKHYRDALVFIGKENPFVQGQIRPIVWQKINAVDFSSKKSNLVNAQKQYKYGDAVKGQAYSYDTEIYQVFIQDYTEPNNPAQIRVRYLLIIDKQSGNVTNETMFSDSEGTSVTPLNYGIDNPNYADLKEQWMGKILKDKPEVIFGFEWVSFGCPTILYANSKDKYIQINCDNRH